MPSSHRLPRARGARRLRGRSIPLSPLSLRLLQATLASLLLLLASGCDEPGPDSEAAAARPRPNVLFILADDLRWDMLRSYGNPTVRTPSLDGLARMGLSFDSFYVANPVCSASRANFLTGRLSDQAGIEQTLSSLGPSRTTIARGTRTVAHVLGDAGYHSGFVGKAHLGGDPLRWGFHEAPFYTPGYQPGEPKEARDRFFEAGVPVQVPGDKSAAIVDAAIAFVERNRERPWFLWLAPTAPHAPYRHNPRHAYGAGRHLQPPGFPPDGPMGDPGSWIAYYSTVSTLDEHLGRLFARLAELGLEEDTLVVFTSDNGVMHGSHGVLSKAMWYEESVRQPLIVRWPGRVRAGGRSDALVSSIDLFATLADLVGHPPVPELRGRSWLPLLEGRSPQRDAVYAQSYRPRNLGGGKWHMLVSEGHKYVELDGRDERLLFDLRNDPHELTNLAGRPDRTALQRRLRERLLGFRSSAS